jgi:hypothetical protein
MADRIPMMLPKVFWDVIEASRGSSDLDFINSVHGHLVHLSPKEVIGFHSRLWHHLGEANRLDLWHAAIPLFGGCNDHDHFRDFGCWLISRGKRAFEEALRDQDSLAAFFHAERFALGDLRDAPEEVWCELTGRGWGAFDKARKRAEKTPWPKELIAPDWPVDDFDECRQRWPRLWAAADADFAAYEERQQRPDLTT